MSGDTVDKLALAGLLLYGIVTAPFVLAEAVRRRVRLWPLREDSFCWSNEEIDRW